MKVLHCSCGTKKKYDQAYCTNCTDKIWKIKEEPLRVGAGKLDKFEWEK